MNDPITGNFKVDGKKGEFRLVLRYHGKHKALGAWMILFGIVEALPGVIKPVLEKLDASLE